MIKQVYESNQLSDWQPTQLMYNICIKIPLTIKQVICKWYTSDTRINKNRDIFLTLHENCCHNVRQFATHLPLLNKYSFRNLSHMFQLDYIKNLKKHSRRSVNKQNIFIFSISIGDMHTLKILKFYFSLYIMADSIYEWL